MMPINKNVLLICAILQSISMICSADFVDTTTAILGQNIILDNCGLNCVVISSLLLKRNPERVTAAVSLMKNKNDYSINDIQILTEKTGLISTALYLDHRKDIPLLLTDGITAIIHARIGDALHYVVCYKKESCYKLISNLDDLHDKPISLSELQKWLETHSTGYIVFNAIDKPHMDSLLAQSDAGSQTTSQPVISSDYDPNLLKSPKWKQVDTVEEWQRIGDIILPRRLRVYMPTNLDGIVYVTLPFYTDRYGGATIMQIKGSCSCYIGTETKANGLSVSKQETNIRALFSAQAITAEKMVELAIIGDSPGAQGVISLYFSQAAYNPVKTFFIISNQKSSGSIQREVWIFEDALTHTIEPWRVVKGASLMGMNVIEQKRVGMYGRLMICSRLQMQLKKVTHVSNSSFVISREGSNELIRIGVDYAVPKHSTELCVTR